MRFRTKITKDSLFHLSSLVATLEKVSSSNCVILLSKDLMRITVVATGPDDVQAFAELQPEHVFEDYNMKLAKRAGGVPHLVVESHMSTMEMNVAQDIPVKASGRFLMNAEEADYYKAPVVPVSQVQLEMPVQRSMRAVVDRMKGKCSPPGKRCRCIDKYLYLDANMRGQLVVRLETDSATIKTFFTQLSPRYEGMERGPQHNRDNKATLKVDAKKLATVLQVYGMSFEGAILCFVENVSLITHVFLAASIGTATFYQPVMVSMADE
ncbi:Hus1-like protein-domain-containing protein [Tribonema minus]|uniref:Checkpoint protein n=1 Tax=Tribonema minus TaxID=303371 RepID=A0A836CCR8_9STRA|nr:Hus1-like protein-domain-containing protein [Tribonema minus]